MMQFSRGNTCNPSRHTTTTLNASSPSSIKNALTGLSSDSISSVNNNDSGLMLNLNCFDQELSFYPMFHGHGHMHVSPSQSSHCQNNNNGECNGHCTDPTQKSNRRLSCPHCSQQLQEIVSREQTEKKEWLRNLQLQQEQQSTAEKHVSICAPYEHVLKEDQWYQFIQQETYFDQYVLNQEEDESNQSQSSCDSNPAGQESSMMKLLMSSSLLPLEEAISSVVGFQSTCTTIVDDKKNNGGMNSNLEQVPSDECQQVATSLSNESTTNKSTTDGVGGEKEKKTRKRKRDFTNNTLTPVRNKFKKCKRPYDMYLQKFSFL